MSQEGPGHFPKVPPSQDFAWVVDLENQDWNMPDWNALARKQALDLYKELKWGMGEDVPSDVKKILKKIVKKMEADSADQLARSGINVDVEGMYRYRLMKLRNTLEAKKQYIPEDELSPHFYGPLLQEIVAQYRKRAW